MRTETFREEHDVELSEEERNLRARQGARLSVAIRAAKKKLEDEAEAWKLRKKELTADEEKVTAALHEVSDAAEQGHERRQVECREALVGVMVITTRLDTGETVHTRAATPDELRPPKREEKGGAKFTDVEIDAKLRASLLRGAAKPITEALLVKNAVKLHPERTAAQVKALVATLVEEGALVERDGKLLAVHAAPAEPDEGIVDDDYKPGVTPH